MSSYRGERIGPDLMPIEIWDEDDDNPSSHSLECTCEHCIQNHPERYDEDDEEPFCYTCISSAFWQECESCGGEGWVESYDDWDDLDSERCCCCNGKGGWWICLGKEGHDLEPGSIHRVPLEERI